MNKAKNFVMTLVNPWFTLTILIESPLLCLLAHNSKNEWDSEKQNKNGHRHRPLSKWGMTKKRGLQNSSWKGMSEEAVMKAVESWVPGKEQAEVHSLFFLQERWGSTRETTKPLVQQDEKMLFFIGNWLGELTRVWCGYSKYLCWRGERADSEVKAEPNM